MPSTALVPRVAGLTMPPPPLSKHWDSTGRWWECSATPSVCNEARASVPGPMDNKRPAAVRQPRIRCWIGIRATHVHAKAALLAAPH